ncbi:serine hydrolase [Streptomyces sp. NPDC048295]|uniref:serine hydrolase n=1 Tax=Streptomyces sp. NPDC048295 TaxID=3154617 RepID=UPI00341AE782
MTGIGMGLINFGGQIAGVVSPIATGWLADVFSCPAAFGFRIGTTLSPRYWRSGCRELCHEGDERVIAELTYGQVSALRALQPEKSCRTTAAEMTRLLRLIRRGKAAAREVCADVRRWLELQVWPHRLRSRCPDDEMRTSGKTGTLPAVRNEVGVVEYPDGGRYSVAVFTRAEDARSRVPERDAFIGLATATAVESLRPA